MYMPTYTQMCLLLNFSARMCSGPLSCKASKLEDLNAACFHARPWRRKRHRWTRLAALARVEPGRVMLQAFKGFRRADFISHDCFMPWLGLDCVPFLPNRGRLNKLDLNIMAHGPL